MSIESVMRDFESCLIDNSIILSIKFISDEMILMEVLRTNHVDKESLKYMLGFYSIKSCEIDVSMIIGEDKPHGTTIGRITRHSILRTYPKALPSYAAQRKSSENGSLNEEAVILFELELTSGSMKIAASAFSFHLLKRSRHIRGHISTRSSET